MRSRSIVLLLALALVAGQVFAQEPRPSTPSEPPSAPEAPEVRIPTPDLPAEHHHEIADGARAQGDLESALYHLERALVSRPGELRWGTEYRQTVIRAADDAKDSAVVYERAIAFLEALAERHPDEPNLWMNVGYAYVDKIPVEGSITQVILANTAIQKFTRALELHETWLGRYTRGNSYMYWPAIFGRTPLGIADLERALEMAEELEQDSADRPAFRGRAWASLGDGHWRLEDRETMRDVWRRGLARYPECPELQERMAREGEELDAYLDALFDTNNRVDTHLQEIWDWQDVRAASPEQE